MKSLYLIIDLASISVPFIFSFHPKIKFYKKFKSLLIGILITLLIFIPWDAYFTKMGYWGFNSDYLTGPELLGLPIEEWLFFVCIPFACIFTHFCLTKFYPSVKIGTKTTRYLSYLIILLSIALCLQYYNQAYTVANFAYAVLIIGLTLRKYIEILQQFYLTFLVILFPFFIVNGLLTGSLIEAPIVWYDNTQNMGIRMFTIPVEDSMYAFTMLLTCYIPVHYFSNKSN